MLTLLLKISVELSDNIADLPKRPDQAGEEKSKKQKTAKNILLIFSTPKIHSSLNMLRFVLLHVKFE